MKWLIWKNFFRTKIWEKCEQTDQQIVLGWNRVESNTWKQMEFLRQQMEVVGSRHDSKMKENPKDLDLEEAYLGLPKLRLAVSPKRNRPPFQPVRPIDQGRTLFSFSTFVRGQLFVQCSGWFEFDQQNLQFAQLKKITTGSFAWKWFTIGKGKLTMKFGHELTHNQ